MDFKKIFEENTPWVILLFVVVVCLLIYFIGTKTGFLSPDGIIANKKQSIRSDIDTEWNSKEFEKAVASINS